MKKNIRIQSHDVEYCKNIDNKSKEIQKNLTDIMNSNILSEKLKQQLEKKS